MHPTTQCVRHHAIRESNRFLFYAKFREVTYSAQNLDLRTAEFAGAEDNLISSLYNVFGAFCRVL